MQILHSFALVLSSKNLKVGKQTQSEKKESLMYKIRTITRRNIQDDKLHLTLILPFFTNSHIHPVLRPACFTK